MQLPPIRFPLWRLMVVIAAVACLTASPVAFSAEPAIAATVLTGWAALYGAPLILCKISMKRLQLNCLDSAETIRSPYAARWESSHFL
jgi:hypothetical protein